MENYKIFISSPSDVNKERQIVENVIKNLNIILNSIYDANLQSIMWENNCFSSIGDSSQEVINIQTLKDRNECSIFLGIMWHRFGTPTENFDSGTAEEFDFFYRKYLNDKKSIDIKFYFNVNQPAKDDLDKVQMSKVLNFKSSIRHKGVLTTDYKSYLHFQSIVMLSLFFTVYSLLNKVETVSNQTLIFEEVEKRRKIFIKVGNQMTNIFSELKSRIGEFMKNVNSTTKEMKEALSEYGEYPPDEISVIYINKLSLLDSTLKTILSDFLKNTDAFPEFITVYTNLLLAVKKSKDSNHAAYFEDTRVAIIEFIDGLKNIDQDLQWRVEFLRKKNAPELSLLLQSVKDECSFYKDLLVNLKERIYK